MKNLLQFLTRYSNFLIFLILEVVAFILITTTNHYQQSATWSAANRFVASIHQTTTSISDYFALRQENERLAQENAALKSQLMLVDNMAEYAIERDSQYIYSHLDWDYIPAKVIGITTHKQHNYLTINKGRRDSIEVDMGVVCQEGVVGIVSAVGERYALVVPLIHTEMNVSCRIQTNNYIGRTHWLGRNHQELQLEDISRHIVVNEGDTIVTSGLTPVFPYGILVGTVSHTDLTDHDNYHHITLQIATDYRKINYVQVIHNRAIHSIDNTENNTLWSGLKK